MVEQLSDVRQKRILVTGSRDWDDFALLHSELMKAWKDLGTSRDTITLVHGACPSGADHFADMIWEVAGQPIERHPAQWRVDGKFDASAGPRRNREMVQAGADLCLAFIRNQSSGATGCAYMAGRAGIPVRRFEVSD